MVVASAEHDAHALGGRVVASALALEGFRVMFLGASVPAADLGDFLDLQHPLALALSCSIPTAFVASGPSVDASHHDLAIPVVGGGRALAHARAGDAAGFRRARPAYRATQSGSCGPGSCPRLTRFAAAPGPIPERAAFAHRSHALVSAAIERRTTVGDATPALAEETPAGAAGRRKLHFSSRSPHSSKSMLQWLRDTGPAHGFAAPLISTQRSLRSPTR